MDFENLYAYLVTLPPLVIAKLYNHPTTCIAVFRELPELSRHLILRLLFIRHQFPASLIKSWFRNYDEVIRVESRSPLIALTQLGILTLLSTQGTGTETYLMNPLFQDNLQAALFGGSLNSSDNDTVSVVDSSNKNVKSVDELDEYANARWECLLHFLSQSSDNVDPITKDMLGVILHANFMRHEGNETVITPAGFQFLLLERRQQVWQFVLHYLDYTNKSSGADLAELLSFLFQLSFSSLGRSYSTDDLSATQLTFLQHLRELGLVWQRKRKEKRYYPTRMAISLSSGNRGTCSSDVTTAQENISSRVQLSSQRQGFIVVETNCRLYAYTESSLEVALVCLFCDVLYRLPNLAVGLITRESVRAALAKGITAAQIISFLRDHVHPESLKKTSHPIPPTVIDQILLWEMERDRFTFEDGVLYSQFLSESDFTLLRDYAKDMSVLLWDNPAIRFMVVKKSGHEDVKRFWKRHKPT